MVIRYLGHSCFQLTSSDGVSLITDPFTKVGYELPDDLKADVITISHGHFDHNYVSAVKGKPEIVSSAGEYKKHDIKIIGKESFHDPLQGRLRGKNIIFNFWIDGIEFCHLGDLGEEISDELLEKIGSPDVLFIPVGGTYTIDAVQAKEYVDRISPKAVIPMHYRPNDGALDITSAEDFLNFYNNSELLSIPNGIMRLFKKDLKADEIQIIYMERMK